MSGSLSSIYREHGAEGEDRVSRPCIGSWISEVDYGRATLESNYAIALPSVNRGSGFRTDQLSLAQF